MTGRLIRTAEDVAEGAQWLCAREPRFADVLAQTGPWPLRLKPAGFAGLVDIIASQQVSVASANAIRARVTEAGLDRVHAVLAAGEEGLRAAGLSRAKARYIFGVAEAGLDYNALAVLPDDDVMAGLTALKGIGPWTAQVYVMFCLGRADVFPAGDLALQEAARALFDLPERPKPDQLTLLAEDWSPWRSVAARALFTYYRVIKQREGIA